MNTLDNVLPGLAAPALVLYRRLRTRPVDERRTYTPPLVPAAVALARGGLIDGGRPALGTGPLARFAPVNVAS